MRIFNDGFADLRETTRREGREHASVDEIRVYDDRLWNSLNSDGAAVWPICAETVPCLCVDATRKSPVKTIIWFHGGGYSAGSAGGRRAFATELSRATLSRVFLPDYRLAPEHSFPASVDDALVTYRWLLRSVDPANIILGGESSGGALAVSAMIAARDAELPMPAAGIAISPIVDWTLSVESYSKNALVDPFVNVEMLSRARTMFLGDQDFRNPLASPLFASLAGLAPLLVLVGSDEVLLDDSLSLAEIGRASGLDVDLEVFDDVFHLWPMFSSTLPEGQEAIELIAEYLRKRWATLWPDNRI